MYKITLFYQSDVAGDCSQIHEYTDVQDWVEDKRCRMLDYIFHLFGLDIPFYLDSEMKEEYLQCHIDELNSKDGSLRKLSLVVNNISD